MGGLLEYYFSWETFCHTSYHGFLLGKWDKNTMEHDLHATLYWWLKGCFFKKTDFTYATPFYRDLSYITDDSSSAGIRDLILSYRSILNESRIKYNDVTFVILAQDAISLKLNLDYLLKYIDSNFLVIGQDSFESICKTYTLDNIQFVHLDITTEKMLTMSCLELILRQIKLVWYLQIV